MNKGGCILLNKKRNKVALVYRKKRNDYSFPKGHTEKCEKLWETALRECEEETGRIPKLISKTIYTKMVYNNESEGKITVYMFYAIDEGATKRYIKKEDKEELVWVDFNKVNELLTYENLKEFWNKALKKLNKIL